VHASVGDVRVTHLATPTPVDAVIVSREKASSGAAEGGEGGGGGGQPLLTFRFEEWVDVGDGEGGGKGGGRTRSVYVELERLRVWHSAPFLQALSPAVQVCCSNLLQCVAVCCCGVLQCVAVCCSVWQCVAVCYSV